MGANNLFSIYPVRPDQEARRRAAMARVYKLLIRLAKERTINMTAEILVGATVLNFIQVGK